MLALALSWLRARRPPLVACTRPNPLFDGIADATSDAGDGDGDPTSTGDGDDDGDSSEGTSESTGDGDGESPTDLPEDPLCPWAQSPGLAIQFGRPNDFGGQCPSGFDGTAKLLSGEGGQAVLSLCNSQCAECSGELELTAFPLVVTNYLPLDADACFKLSAQTPLGQVDSVCVWGAVSVRDSITLAPYVIATARSSPPPIDVIPLVDAIVPDPLEAGACNCEDIDQGNDCCYQAVPPSFGTTRSPARSCFRATTPKSRWPTPTGRSTSRCSRPSGSATASARVCSCPGRSPRCYEPSSRARST